MQICVSIQEVSFTHIHVHPDVVLFADVRDGDEGVKGSVHCCSSSCTYKERYKTLQKHREMMQLQQCQYVSKFLSLSVWFQSTDYHKISQSTVFIADLLMCITFCLASSILLSRSAGIILPLQRKNKL